jgi:serine protease AprX
MSSARARAVPVRFAVGIAVGAVALGLAAPAGAVGPGTGPPAPGSGQHGRGVVGTRWGDAGADAAGLDGYGRNDVRKDAGSLYSVTRGIGANVAWNSLDATGRAITGQGVSVALLDSGVTTVSGLDVVGKVTQGPDLSLESNSDDLARLDTFGHGTHLAGIIGARDEGVPVDPKTGRVTPDPARQIGVAPGAGLLALKLATTDGSTDVSQVIAALDWVVAHRRDNGMNVRVINLSFGTAALQPYQIDPLATAAELAWRAGVVVVVSGGNDGAAATALSNPAIDPYVLAVGAADPQDDPTWTRPVLAGFSSRGTAARHVDLLAPGRSIVSLRDPGSFVDVENPGGRVSGDRSGRLFRGSGTSQAAAVVSGAAALLLQARPDLTPDAVKAALVRTATPITGLDPVAGGAGLINVARALVQVRKPSFSPTTGRQTFPVADGSGSLEAARGGSNLADPVTGDQLSGEVDILGTAWDGPAWAAASASGTAWSQGLWRGARWAGDGWTSTGWARARWAGSAWARARWADASWDRARWARARWAGAGWERARWASSAWS